ncbi:S-layer protein [Clostridium tetani]|uniref:S-layer protein n=2 Tax=Clostridium tetani TaxID=1513 RepID=UPI0003C0C9CC|nr:S-layer protein [Clostridium tetani]CDI48529.1 S-layer protein [Clostridium tetani 12124569]
MAKKKMLNILSNAAVGVLIATALGTGVYAKVTDVIVNSKGKDYSYDYKELKSSYAKASLGIEGAGQLFDDYSAKLKDGSLKAYNDDKNGYIEYGAIRKAAALQENFDLNTYTESEAAKAIEVEAVAKVSVKDGKIFIDGKEQEAKIKSVKAIDANKINVTLQNGEVITVDLETPLVDGATHVTFTHNGQKFVDVELESPYVAPVEKEYALNIQVNDVPLVADGKTVMQVTAEIKGADAKNFKGMAEFVSKQGLPSAQKEAAFDNGKVTFNVTLPNSKIDIQDEIKVRIKSHDPIANNENLVGLESNVKALTYAGQGAEDKEDNETIIKTYSIDRVASADLADRVVVYVGNVKETHIEEVKKAILDQVKVYTKDPMTGVEGKDINLVEVVESTPVKGGYAFTALIELPGYSKDLNEYEKVENKNILIDNQYNYYHVLAPKANIRLSEMTKNATNKFMLVDKVKPEVRDVIASKNEKGDNKLPKDSLLVVFSEPVSRLTAENPNNYILNGNKLTAKDVNSIKVLDVTDNVKYAESNGKERRSVIVSLNSAFARKQLRSGKNLLQVRSIADWAGMYDLSDNNKITTQDFVFNYETPKADTGLSIKMESPEQFVLTLNDPLYTDVNATKEYKLTDNGALEVSLGDTIIPEDKYEITYVAEEDAYILELKDDWTKILVAPRTYHNETFKVKTKNAYDVYGKEVKAFEVKEVIPEDTTSPKIAEYEIKDLKVDTSKTETLTGKINITMTEPVQLYENAGVQVVPPITPSKEQEQGKGVPVPTFEYVKVSDGEKLSAGDKVTGKLIEIETNHDKNFTVEPSEKLEEGDWKLVVRQISDDVGNTMATEEISFKIVKADDVPVVNKEDNVVDPYIIWAFADDNKVNNDKSVNDYVYILYSRQMSIDAIRSATYDINGKQVTQDADITAEDVVLYRQNEDDTNPKYNVFYGENGNKDQWKGQLVTIKLPKDFIVGGDDIDGDNPGDKNNKFRKNVLTVPTKFEAINDEVDTTVETLRFDNNGGSNQFELKFETKITDGMKLPQIAKNLEYKDIESFRKLLAANAAKGEKVEAIEDAKKDVASAKAEAAAVDKAVKDAEKAVEDAKTGTKEEQDKAAEVLKKAQEDKAKADKAVSDAEAKQAAAEKDLKDAEKAAEDKANAEKAAKEAVAKAEGSKLQADVDAAKALVNALADDKIKGELNTKLDEIKVVAAPTTHKVTISGDAAETTDYTVAGAADLNTVANGTDITITAVTDITVDGEEVAAKATKTIKVNAATTITINKKAAAVPTTHKVTISGDAAKTTDYTVAGAADLNTVANGTDITITAVTDITVNGEEVAAKATKTIKVDKATTITINKKAAAVPTTHKVTINGDAAKTTDYTVEGAADLNTVADGTDITITAVTDITVNGEEVAASATKTIKVDKDTIITINKKA